MMGRLATFLPKRVRTRIRRVLDPALARIGCLRFDVKRHYAQDGLFTVHNADFRRDPQFRKAYTRGIQASWGVDPGMEWRVHVALWAAATALRSPGDFVECGVNAGFVSSAIMHCLDWAGVPRKFYLIDTFSGPVVEQFSAEELKQGKAGLTKELLERGSYVTDVKRVRANFAEWPNAVIVRGPVPEILATLEIPRVAFLHIDMNSAYPECAALMHFWPRLSPGALVLFDDYANHEHRYQKEKIDETVRELRAEVLSLPTGQGLVVR
ncbi:MAG TPA: TylF/MycF/NovP-related O-methyltransferase [Bryobacteraceae bacterium]|jgi:hypothetical protein|nr:TylF/MycF/NovP-related O-methyltransferase [Bryobacteraceae bacterium]